MDLKKYKRYQKSLYIFLLLLPAAGGAVSYLALKNVRFSLITAGFLILGWMPFYLQNRLNDRYISSLVEDLSRLCDNLAKLEEKEIFPGNEDTLLSKLQHRVIILVRIYRRKNQSSLQEQEKLKALASDISHQLKTPLANLKMYAEFLDDDTLSEDQRKEYLDIMKLSIERLNFLSESMIKMSRLESGLIHLHSQRQSINETVLTAIKDIFAKALEKEIEITYADDEDLLVSHDRQWTAEAVFNLLDNAVKYSPPKSVIAVSIRRLGLFLSIDVEDQAKAIALEERPKIFQRFYRGTNSHSVEGIGIGLYLSREIAIKQGGYINLAKGAAGNQFSLFLPID